MSYYQSPSEPDPYRPPVVSGSPVSPEVYGQPYPPQPTSPAGYDQPPQQEPAKSKLLPLAALALTLVVAATAGWFVYDRLIKTDSGIAACEAMRDGDKTFTGDKQDNKPMTEDEYRELRAVFEDSRHEDIRDHGTKLMDLVWQVSKLGDEPGLAALPLLGPLTEHVTGLQSACADQGVILNLDMGK